DSDPSEDSLPLAPELPLVLPLLCFDDSEVDNEYEPAEQRPERHESLRGGGTGSHLGHHHRRDHHLTTLLHHHLSFPLLLLLPHLGFIDGHRFLSDPVKLSLLVDLTTPILMGRVSYFTSDSSSSSSSSDSSSDTSPRSSSNSLLDSSSVHSSGCDAVGQSHSGPSTRFASPRSAPLSTPYPPTTLESSQDSSFERSLDSSSPSARPSRKRCRSPTILVSPSTPIPRLRASTHVDLLPPRKRFRDSYSPEDSGEEHMEIGTADEKAVADLGIGDGVGVTTEDGICMGVEVATSDIREDKEELEAEASMGGMMEITVDPLVTGGISESTGGDVPDLEGTLYDIAYYMSEVPLDR
ncbi:hypothetical protein Tco_1242439, partial [Tanacetum coccineum]